MPTIHIFNTRIISLAPQVYYRVNILTPTDNTINLQLKLLQFLGKLHNNINKTEGAIKIFVNIQ